MSEHLTPYPIDMLRGRRIMVVDDNVEERLLLATYLQQEGCRVYLAQDGLDGLRKIGLTTVDLVLLDIGMPVCDGLTACRILKADPRTRGIPVIFLTGAANPGDRVNGLLAGAADYVCKPFVFDEVRLRLIVHLRTRPSAAAAAPAPSSPPSDDQAGRPSSPGDSTLFQSARTRLLLRLGQTPDLVELASALNTNTRRLDEAFRRCVGVTVFEYLREERLKKACELLSASTLQVQAIAPRLGFGSATHFTAAFKERFGLSPRDFRAGLATASPIRADGRPGRAEDAAAGDRPTARAWAGS